LASSHEEELAQKFTHNLMTILNELSMPSLWKAGRGTGWLEALMENSPRIFRSLLAEERMTVLQEA
jgi:hypothetical protein